MRRTSSRIATSCPSMEILKPGHRHPRNPLFAPHSSECKLIMDGSITFAFFLREALRYLCRNIERSCVAERTRAPSEPSNPYHLRDFPIGKFVSKALHPLHSFQVFYPCDLLHFLRTSKDESPSRESPRSNETACHSASSMSAESPSQG